jgi:hypothetical protein
MSNFTSEHPVVSNYCERLPTPRINQSSSQNQNRIDFARGSGKTTDRLRNQQVGGSIPLAGSIISTSYCSPQPHHPPIVPKLCQVASSSQGFLLLPEGFPDNDAHTNVCICVAYRHLFMLAFSPYLRSDVVGVYIHNFYALRLGFS